MKDAFFCQGPIQSARFHDQNPAMERSHLKGSANRRPPDFGVPPKPLPAKCFRKRTGNQPGARLATRGMVGQETGTWGEGAGAGRTGAGGTERSTPSD